MMSTVLGKRMRKDINPINPKFVEIVDLASKNHEELLRQLFLSEIQRVTQDVPQGVLGIKKNEKSS